MDFSYTFQVLYNNGSSFAVIHNLLAYNMVPISHKPFFPARNLLEKSSGATGAFSLKFTSQFLEFDSFELNLFGIEKLPIACYSNLVYSDINTKNSVLEARAIGIGIFGKTEQEETSISFIYSQKTFSNIPIEISSITIWNVERNLNSTFDCSQAQNVVLERSRTREIVSHTNLIDYWLTFSSFNHSTSLFDTSNSQLALQSFLHQRFIYKRVEFNIVPYFSLPSLINTELQSFGIDFESFNYLWSCSDFDFSSCSRFHTYKESTLLYKLCPHLSSDQWVEIGGWQFLPQLKLWVSLPNFL
jgi:hypothetical protein